MTEEILSKSKLTDVKKPDPLRYQIDGQLGEAVAGLGRVRFMARLVAVVVAGAAWAVGGESWLVGAMFGGLVVEVNLTLLKHTLGRAKGWHGRALWPTLLGFYLAFGATVGVCFLVVRQNWGHPGAFLMGLASFFVGLVLALLSFTIKRPKPGPQL